MRQSADTTLEDITIKPGERLMGLDLGTKTIGLALSDIMHQVATPLDTIRRKKFKPDADRLLQLATEHTVTCFVIGLPVNMDGSSGPRVQSTRAFVANMQKLTDTPFVYWDERMSTQAVERVMIQGDASRAKRARVIDQLAAAYILQGALDRLANIRASIS